MLQTGLLHMKQECLKLSLPEILNVLYQNSIQMSVFLSDNIYTMYLLSTADNLIKNMYDSQLKLWKYEQNVPIATSQRDMLTGYDRNICLPCNRKREPLSHHEVF